MKNSVSLFLFHVLLLKYVYGNHVEGSNDITLTTARTRDTTSPKPTTMFRRIDVEAHIYDESNTPIDMFSLDSRRKSARDSDIWNWDEWCQLQPKVGPCDHNITKYYYNSQLDKCLKFTYSGCDSNRNNFDTEVDCERHCKGHNNTIAANTICAEYCKLIEGFVKNNGFPQSASFMIKIGNVRPTFCFLQPDVGVCLALIPKYYFDINEKTCKKFIYGGCGGNMNKFDTFFSCVNACKKFTE